MKNVRYLSVRYPESDYKTLSILGVLLQKSVSEITRDAIEEYKAKNLDTYILAQEIAEAQNTIQAEVID
jgi:predicted DNA-binding protein